MGPKNLECEFGEDECWWEIFGVKSGSYCLERIKYREKDDVAMGPTRFRGF